MKFVVRWILTAVAVMVAAWVVPGMGFVGSDFAAALWTALALAFVNTWIKPLLSMMALPLTIVSLGLFALVINAGISQVIVRDDRDHYRKIDVQDWIINDESIEGVFGY